MYPPPDNRRPGSMLGWTTAEQILGVKSLVVRSHEDCGQRMNKRTCIVSMVNWEKAMAEISQVFCVSAYCAQFIRPGHSQGQPFPCFSNIIWLFHAQHYALQFVSLCMCEICTSMCVCACVVRVFKRHQQPTSLLPAGLLVKGLNKLWERDWDGCQGKRTEGSQHCHFALLYRTTLVCGPLFSIFYSQLPARVAYFNFHSLLSSSVFCV